MRDWPYRRDKQGAPQRFESHGQAAWWAVATVAKLVSLLLVLAAGNLIATMDGRSAEDLYFQAGVFLLFWLAVWLVLSALFYLYFALSGGVMSREERRRKNLPG